MNRLRPVMESAWDALKREEIPIVMAPTGYGKTKSSPEIYRRAHKAGLAAGLIHVAPLKALVRSIYQDHFSKFKDVAGYQSGDSLPGGHKSPYYLKRLVVTTLESYFWNVFKLPVVEYAKVAAGNSQGHYYPILASIVSYVNVFDEAHMYLDGSRDASSALMLATISFLAGYGTPLIIESATIHSSLVRDLMRILRLTAGSRVRVIALEGNNKWLLQVKKIAKERDYVSVEAVNDNEFKEIHSIDWKTKIIKNKLRSILNQACQDSRKGYRVLITFNTVPKAIGAYQYLVEDLGCNSVLLHGRLSEKDKKNAIEKTLNTNLIVSTQIIEAGVDINAHILYTEVAPIESLVQRAGRLCRRDNVLQDCKLDPEAGKIVIIGGPLDSTNPYSEKALKNIVNHLKSLVDKEISIDWRLPDSRREITPYSNLVEKLSEFKSGFPGKIIALTRGFRQILAAEPKPGYVLGVLDRLNICSITGSSIQVKILVGSDPKEEYVNLDFSYLAKRWNTLKKYLVGNEDFIKIVFAESERSCVAKELTVYLSQFKYNKISCRRLAMLLQRDIKSCGIRGYTGDFYIKVIDKAYIEGLGLIADIKDSKKVIR